MKALALAVLAAVAVAGCKDSFSNETWLHMGTPSESAIPRNRPYVVADNGCRRFTSQDENYLYSVCPFGNTYWKRRK